MAAKKIRTPDGVTVEFRRDRGMVLATVVIRGMYAKTYGWIADNKEGNKALCELCQQWIDDTFGTRPNPNPFKK